MNDFKRQATENLDNLLTDPHPSKPRNGWIRAIREGLWMSSYQLAKRLGLSQNAIIKLEQHEQNNTITLASLEKAAKALGCKLEVNFIPHIPLKEMLMKQARAYAKAELTPVFRTMSLENQALTSKDTNSRINNMADDLIRKGSSKIWNIKNEI